ncbi:MAG: carboxypeptidase-like regulatory domain-containing protein, partial [Bacteroidales bacterium]|nr:carboxypeptidase-like regulatory domain-containing protein [Bacteroidales bacterium]
MMRNMILILIVTSVSLQLSGQDRIVTGHITDNRNVPIVGPTVCQVNTTNCTRADQEGIFHLPLLPGKEMTLKVECLGFNPVEVVLDDSAEYPLEIVLTPSYI